MLLYEFDSNVVYSVYFTEILYERLVDVDQVDFLFAPFGADGLPILLFAESRGVPIINPAVFEYAFPFPMATSVYRCLIFLNFSSVFFLPNTWKWVITTTSSLFDTAPACGIPL